jgi:hypothetical protein
MQNESIKLTGQIKFDLLDSSGSLKETREIKNVVVTVGKTFLAAWLAAASQADYFMKYVGLGEGLTAANASDTDLETPLPTRVIGTISSATNVWQNQASFGPGVNTGAVSEAGLFSAASGGTLLAHQVFGVITKSAGDTLQVTWQITLS